jgi:hypothetical protein
MPEPIVVELDVNPRHVRYFQQRISQTSPFNNTKVMAAGTLDAEAISWSLSKQLFHGHYDHYSRLMGPFVYIVQN